MRGNMKVLLAVFSFMCVVSIPVLNANENIIKFFDRFNSPFITQGEWAVYLVKATGQAGKISTAASEVDYVALLEKNHIAPLDGWQLNNYLNFGDKSVTMVQALNLTGQLPENPTVQDYIWLLEGMGFHEGTPNELVRRTEAVQLNINDPIYQEPIGNRYHINLSPFAPKTSESMPSLEQ